MPCIVVTIIHASDADPKGYEEFGREVAIDGDYVMGAECQQGEWNYLQTCSKLRVQ